MGKSKYCYAIVKKDNGQLLLKDHKLPIYWNKKVAQDVCKNFTGYCVHAIILEKLEYFLLTTTTK